MLLFAHFLLILIKILKYEAQQFDNDFEIKSKYYRRLFSCFKARILSLQDVIFRSVFPLILYEIVCW